MLRSMLFLPGNNPNMLINGNCLGADAVIFDLEDAVSPAEKDAARILVRNTMRYMDFGGCGRIVRINSIDTPYWRKDLDQIMPYKPDMILLPKSGSAADVLAADQYMTELEEKLGFEANTVGLMPLIETAMGVENSFAIASSTKRITEAVERLFDRIVHPDLLVRRMYVVANHVIPEQEAAPTGADAPVQLDMFTDYEAQARQAAAEQAALDRERRRQQTILEIKRKYGKNAILRGMNLEEGATARSRNAQIGGHKA